MVSHVDAIRPVLQSVGKAVSQEMVFSIVLPMNQHLEP